MDDLRQLINSAYSPGDEIYLDPLRCKEELEHLRFYQWVCLGVGVGLGFLLGLIVAALV